MVEGGADSSRQQRAGIWSGQTVSKTGPSSMTSGKATLERRGNRVPGCIAGQHVVVCLADVTEARFRLISGIQALSLRWRLSTRVLIAGAKSQVRSPDVPARLVHGGLRVSQPAGRCERRPSRPSHPAAHGKSPANSLWFPLIHYRPDDACCLGSPERQRICFKLVYLTEQVSTWPSQMKSPMPAKRS